MAVDTAPPERAVTRRDELADLLGPMARVAGERSVRFVESEPRVEVVAESNRLPWTRAVVAALAVDLAGALELPAMGVLVAVLAARALGAAAIAGHWYPVFNRFRGGAGLATGSGVVLALIPVPGIIGLAVGALAISRIKSSGHSALIGIIVTLVIAALIRSDWPVGAEWPAMVSAVGVAAALFAKAAAQGWKPGRKD